MDITQGKRRRFDLISSPQFLLVVVVVDRSPLIGLYYLTTLFTKSSFFLKTYSQEVRVVTHDRISVSVHS